MLRFCSLGVAIPVLLANAPCPVLFPPSTRRQLFNWCSDNRPGVWGLSDSPCDWCKHTPFHLCVCMYAHPNPIIDLHSNVCRRHFCSFCSYLAPILRPWKFLFVLWHHSVLDYSNYGCLCGNLKASVHPNYKSLLWYLMQQILLLLYAVTCLFNRMRLIVPTAPLCHEHVRLKIG